MTRHDIPIIDLTPYFEGGQDSKRKVAADMNRACEDIVFLLSPGMAWTRTLPQSQRRISGVLRPTGKRKINNPADI